VARKIAFFNTDQAAIGAINKLEQAGFVAGELQVLAINGEHTGRIEGGSDLKVDELQSLEEADSRRYGWPDINGAATPVLFGTAAGAIWTNSIAAPAVLAETFNIEGDREKEALKSYGLDDDEIRSCLAKLHEGAVAVIVETDEKKTFLDKDSGPDISRLGVAEGIFRGCGGSPIISGS